MEDEGYNVEWSQELRIQQSIDEYVRAWVLIHALHHKLGFPGESPGVVFNLSVGYDLAGIRQPNMQLFFDQMRDCSELKHSLVDEIALHYPEVRDIDIPDRISDNVTLSTMHGCPPDEIESICAWLLKNCGLHTLIKCNPTLLGPERVRGILNKDLQYTDVVVPDAAFEHDLAYEDAVPMLRGLQALAAECGLEFGVKLSNTLEVENFRPVFAQDEKMMYLSGRALHSITVNLAAELERDFNGTLPMSFSAGANCFNAPDLLAAGMQTITVCSDLLKTGGYLRLLQYLENADAAFRNLGASSIDDYIFKVASSDPAHSDMRAAAQLNLTHYAGRVTNDVLYVKSTFSTSHTKTGRELGYFDCIQAPCVDECPLDQKVSRYMAAVRDGDGAEALRVVRQDNPLPCVLGRVCDHLCEQTCVRTHLDEPVAIRDIKRYVTDLDKSPTAKTDAAHDDKKVAIIGAGPAGMAAALELGRAGCDVDVFEQHGYAGGMVGGAVPEYRLPQDVFDRDLKPLQDLGVKIHYGKQAGRDFTLSQLRNDGYDNVAIMVGAQLGKTLGLDDEECEGVIDALQFLRDSREDQPQELGQRIGIIGAGDTAMDCARVARRLSGGDVSLVYRRTIDQMPADREEITHLLEEGIAVLELLKPQQLVVKDGRLHGLICRRTEYKGDRDASGRKIPHEIAETDFELPLDTLILAISQHAVLDFFDNEPIKVNDRGYIDVDPISFETSVSGVYAGGDVANEGPASIVKAAAAGKAIADAILNRDARASEPLNKTVDTAELQRRKSHREWRVPAPHVPLEDRHGFEEVVLTYSKEQARNEAARCLDCDRYCSICVGVCPNLALLTYEAQTGDGSVRQPYQVAVIADLCNECGNCTTFCPTSGRPYREKPRLYLDRGEFESQHDNAFMVFRDGERWQMDARAGGVTHHIDLDDKPVDTEPEAAMHVLLEGISRSTPHIPTANVTGKGS
jgi:putative selenate reductase